MMKIFPKIIGPILLSLLLVSRQSHSRWIGPETSHGVVSAGLGSSTLELVTDSVAVTVTCEPIYGFLPCSTNVWGLLFLVVVYEILLSVGGQYVANGSNLFFQITGPGVFGASLFQLLGTIPQIVLVLVSALSGSDEAAQQRATLGMGLVAGTTVMLLTLIWGISVVVGSYDLSASSATGNPVNSIQNTTKANFGVVTDVETSYTARIILATLIPFLVLLLAKFFTSSRRYFILAALIITIALLIGYILYQIFQPWIQNRRFEYLMNKYAKDKLLRLVSRNGKPDTRRIQQLFDKIKRSDSSVSTTELKFLFLGVRMDEDDKSTEADAELIMNSFDTSGDGSISQDEFIQGMTKLVSDLSNQTSPQRRSSTTSTGGSGNTSQNGGQGLLASSTSTSQVTNNSWWNYLTAAFYLILGTLMLCALAEPLIRTVIDLAQAANLSSFVVSYLAIPFAMNYGAAIQSITSARQRTQHSISLTLSSIYNGVYMNNVIGLIVYLAPVYARNLTAEASAEILVVMIFCIGINIFVSFCTTFLRWVGWLVLLLYPISLVSVYFITSIVG